MKYLTETLIVCKRGENVQVSKNFWSSEFEDGFDDWVLIDLELVRILQLCRDELGPIEITSGYRSEEKTADLKRQGYETVDNWSTHQVGAAADWKTGKHSGDELEKVARKHGFKAVGVGSAFVHTDLRNDKVRRWTYSY